MTLTLDGIVALYHERGTAQYGREAVSQLAHALQCARLAEEADASPALIAASLLHDLGHLLGDRDDEFGHGADDVHQYRAGPALEPLFPAAVIEPIRLHVDAKRYLCAVEPAYWDTLSPESRRSLEIQGGIFRPEDADNFMRHPYAGDAVWLRRWDDLAKVPDRTTPDLAHYARVLQSVVLAPAA
jgi:phosphonate degradation associated HDIG domain protein